MKKNTEERILSTLLTRFKEIKMDLLQSTIRTLFYDVNIERIFQDIKNDSCTFLKCDFASLSAWTTQTFTRSELALLQSYIVQNTIEVTPKWHHSM